MAFVTLMNIQSFRGEFSYEIDSGLTVINSKNNGVGKTTLYDCIRLTCDIELFDKEELQFILNINETQGFFSYYDKGVTVGFSYQKGYGLEFFKKVDDEPIVRSDSNFPDAPAVMGVVILNGGILNVIGKELDLFSGSSTRANYQLVKLITTHKKTQEVTELLVDSLEENKQLLKRLRESANYLDNQRSGLFFYPNVGRLEELLKDDSYELCEGLLTDLYKDALTLVEYKHIEVSLILDVLLDLTIEAESLCLKKDLDISLSALVELAFYSEQVESLTFVPILPLKADVLALLNELTADAETLVMPLIALEANVQCLEHLDNLTKDAESMDIVAPLEASANLLQLLGDLTIIIEDVYSELIKQDNYRKWAEEIRESIAQYKVSCPIREEVYLVDGECVY